MKKENVFMGGGIVAAVAASLCCVLPLVAVVFGLGAFGVASVFETLRPYLLVLAFGALGYGFYRVYFRREGCAPWENCATKPVNKINKFSLWIASALIVTFALVPYYSGYIAAAVTASPQPSTEAVPVPAPLQPAAEVAPISVDQETAANKTIVIEVKGMTCAGCEANLEIPLGKLRGVVSVDADYKKHNVTVVYDPAQVTVKQIKEAITATGYEVM